MKLSIIRKLLGANFQELSLATDFLSAYENQSDDCEVTISDLSHLNSRVAVLLNDIATIITALEEKNIEIERFYNLYNYLCEKTIVNQNLLSWCYNLLLMNTQTEKEREADIYISESETTHILDVFIQLNNANIQLHGEILKKLSLLSFKKGVLLHQIVTRLSANNTLNSDTFITALNRISKKLDKITEVKVEKESRKQTNQPRSKFTITDSTKNLKISFFRECGGVDGGGNGIIARGHECADVNNPLFAIKKLRRISPRAAEHEVKYHRLLGRQAFCIINQKETKIISDWQKGEPLEFIKSSQLMSRPFKQRLHCLISGVSDLNVLHSNNRFHGDIKPHNFIIDLENSSMSLIDFEESHKRSTCRYYGPTKEYADPNAQYKGIVHLGYDMYAMGLVTMKLFPEIYTVSYENEKITIRLNKTEPTRIETVIIKLVDAMMDTNLNQRCSSEQVLKYCSDLINHFYTLNDTKLKQMTAELHQLNSDSFEQAFQRNTQP